MVNFHVMLDVNQIHVRLNGYRSHCRNAHSEDHVFCVTKHLTSNKMAVTLLLGSDDIIDRVTTGSQNWVSAKIRGKQA